MKKLFNFRLDYIQVLIISPIILLGIILFEMSNRNSDTLLPAFVSILLVLTVFTNGHSILSFLNVLWVPELQNWQKQIRSEGINFWLRCTVIFVLLLAITLIFNMMLLQGNNIKLLQVPYKIIILQHFVFQNIGVMRIIYEFKRDDKNYLMISRCYKLIFFIYLVKMIPRYFFPSEMDSYYLVLATGLACLLVYQIVRSSLNVSRQLAVFNLRSVLIVLWPFSNVALAFSGIIHALDYFLINSKIVKNSQMENSNKKRLILICLALVPIISVGVVLKFEHAGKFFWMAPQNIPLWAQFYAALTVALTSAHAYSDYLMFKFRHKYNQEVLGLLTKSS